MIQVVQQLWSTWLLVLSLSHSIEPYTPNLTTKARIEYSSYMVSAGQETGLDPYLIAAVMWHESDFQNVPGNETNDYGLMQVHWQPQERWLAGITRERLMDPRTNIYVGARELAHLRAFCKSHDAEGSHYWMGHYKYGIVVPSGRYGEAILGRWKILSRSPHPAT